MDTDRNDIPNLADVSLPGSKDRETLTRRAFLKQAAFAAAAMAAPFPVLADPYAPADVGHYAGRRSPGKGIRPRLGGEIGSWRYCGYGRFDRYRHGR